MAEQVAKFRFLNFSISESHFKIEPSEVTDFSLDINVDQTTYENEEEGKMKLELTVMVSDEKKMVDINVKANGIFEYDKDIDEKTKESFFTLNAPAILFPYVRAYVSSLTALSGMPPITLPTINLASTRQ